MTKFLVFVCGQLTIFPLLTPIVVFTILWAIHRFFLKASLAHVNAALIFFAGVIITGYATWTVYEEGPRLYVEFLEKRGVETSADIISVKRALAIPQFEDRDQVTVKFTNKDGVEIKALHQAEARRFYPPIEGVIPPPKVGDRLRILYYPEAEASFIVLTDPAKSRYGESLRCAQLAHTYEVTLKRYKFQDYPSAELKNEFRSLIDERLRSHCLSMDEREALRKEQERIQ